MDRARRAEPYSSATIWTREIARNLAGHLSRVSKAHSCVDTRSPKSTRLPQFHHTYVQKRCPTSPIKTRQSVVIAARHSEKEPGLEFHGFVASSAREEAENTPRSVRKPFGVYSQRVDSRRRKSLPRKIKSISVQTQADSEDGSTVLTVNQDSSEQSVKTPVIKAPAKQALRGNTRDGATYACPSTLPHHRHRAVHDYNKRQEQRKIWQENQALSKRLQSTKATLNSKEWEKDDKWTQEFLKNQERRRSALHQEMRKAQASPQAVLRIKPLKINHPPHLKDAPHQTSSEKNLRSACSPLKADIQGAMTAREPPRRGFREHELPKDRSKSGASSQHPTAANHRRIMELRKKNPAPTGPESKIARPDGVLGPASYPAPVREEDYTSNALDKATELQNDEVVNVRFTFSRGRSRGTSCKAGAVGDLDRVDALEMDSEQERDVMSLSGAFSPGIELESALYAAAIADDVPIAKHGRSENEDVAEVVLAALQGCIDSVIYDSGRILDADGADHGVVEHEGVSAAGPTEISVASTSINDGPTSADAEDDEVVMSPNGNLCDPTEGDADDISSKLEDLVSATDGEPIPLQVEIPSLVSDEGTPSSPRATDLHKVGVDRDDNLEPTIDEHTGAPKQPALSEDGEGPEEAGDMNVEQQAGAIIAAPIVDTPPLNEISLVDDAKDDEEGYEEEYFEEEPVSARASEGGDTAAPGSSMRVDAKEEASGYGSAFEEDEDPGRAEENAEQGSTAVLVAPGIDDDKDEEDEVSYSHDDFDPPETPPLSSPDSRPLSTPSSASSRLSWELSAIGSASSSRRRSLHKDQSTHRLEQVLGKKTSERASRSVKGPSPARSRQLDFDEQEKEGGGDNSNSKARKEKDDEIADSDGPDDDASKEDEAAVAQTGTAPAPGDGVLNSSDGENDRNAGEPSTHRRLKTRRRTVFWTEKEENRLRKGVQQFGVGKWKTILLDGQGVFHEHRTNVDLKDKWTNLQLRKGKPRRFKASVPHEDDEEEKEITDDGGAGQPRSPRPKRRRRVERRTSAPSQTDEMPESEEEVDAASARVSRRPQRKAAMRAIEAMAEVAIFQGFGTRSGAEQCRPVDAGSTSPSRDDEVTVDYEYAGSESEEKEESSARGDVDSTEEEVKFSSVSKPLSPIVTLKIATDETYPAMQTVKVELTSCADVSALKARLRSSILSAAPTDAEIQLIALKSQCLLDDGERLEQCVSKNGQEFYAIVDKPS